MAAFREITPDQFSLSPFSLFAKDWALLTASDGSRTNTMTVGWGGLGIMWGKPVTMIVVRPQRYTYDILEHADGYSLTFFEESYRKQLSFCGQASGKDCDKFKECGFTLEYEGNIPYIVQSVLAITCRKLYYQDLDPTQFLDAGIDSKWYPEKDYHRMYLGEISKILTK